MAGQSSPTPDTSRTYLLDLPPAGARAALEAAVAAAGEPPYRARQAWEYLFRRRERRWDRMKTLPAALRESLGASLGLAGLAEDTVSEARDGTRKALWTLRDGMRVESVRIPTAHRVTLCVSSQVGCPLACTFCATGYMGLRRNLTGGEIVEQALGMLAGADLPEGVNVVFMGMGEPLLNLDSVLAAARWMNAPEALGIGARRITISTVGFPEGIRAIAEDPLQLRLAISLHAARDPLRSELMPINRRHPVEEVIGAVREYSLATGRQVSFEYVHLPGVNDSPADVAALRRLLGSIPGRVNVIPFNEITQAGYRAPTEKEVHAFASSLRDALRQPVSVRARRGEDVAAACGQLWVARAEKDSARRARRGPPGAARG